MSPPGSPSVEFRSAQREAGPAPRVRVLETVNRHAVLGIRFWDLATGNTVVDGLAVEVFARARPQVRAALRSNRSGVYVAHQVPGLRSFEFSDLAPDDLWQTPPAPYRVELTDPAGRFLPSGFDVDLPLRGLFEPLLPWLSPPQTVSLPMAVAPGFGSPPERSSVVPLFSAPSRPLPEPLGVVHAQLRWRGSGAAAPWALLALSLDGKPRGLGLSDADGRVGVFFGYPEPPRRLLLSPPEQHDDFMWTVGLNGFGDAGLPADIAPDLARVLGQLDQPRTLPPPAPALRLRYREPLVARTPGGQGDDAAYLYLAA